jgi:eukaryotic-like serine/threonine-protein kinase
VPGGFPSGVLPPENERTVIKAESPLAREEQTDAGQDAPTDSNLPTQRPEPGKALPQPQIGPSPFAGLLAEAEATQARPKKPQPAASDKSAGRTLGAYRILGELGSGGMAIVYKALQPALDRLVAIKELRPEYVGDKQIIARFEREATSLGALQHGNIVHIYDFIRDVEGAYIVMEYVEGIDLFDLLHKVGRLPPEIAAIVALQLAEGLEYAHYHSIIHRDVKPSNLLVSKFGEVKIMDFGIARDPGRADLTQVGMSLGTPAYMSPEQIRGDKIDSRADLFAVGIVLYEMLTGKKPWGEDEGTSIARKVLYQDMRSPLEYVPDLPPALVRIMQLCLHKRPEDRYATTHQLRRELEAYVGEAVRIDPRQRLVVFLRNRGILSEGEASGFVTSSVLVDGVLRRRDLGLPSIPPESLLRPVAAANLAALIMIVAAAVIALLSPFSSFVPLPSERPSVSIVSRESKPVAPEVPEAPRSKRRSSK